MLDICFDDAIGRAKELDAYYKRNGKVIGPLHGLPVTFKDQFHIKGRETTLGYVGWIGTFEGRKNDPNKGTVDSELIRELVQLGAIPIGKVSESSPSDGINILNYGRRHWYRLYGYAFIHLRWTSSLIT